jgi:myo-inositol catabolism protein IolC
LRPGQSLTRLRVGYPGGNQDLNRRQVVRLKRLSDYLHRRSQSRFMLEMLVRAEKAQLELVDGDHQAFHLKLRPRLMVQAIHELQDVGVEPDVWKVEGLDRGEEVVAAARRGGRGSVGCILLSRDENDEKIRERLITAAGVPGFISFTVGGADFCKLLVGYRAGKITREAAVVGIAAHYQEFMHIFENARAGVSAAGTKRKRKER